MKKVRLILLTLCTVFIFSVLSIPLTAAAEEPDALDFSTPAFQTTKELDAAEYIELITGDVISDIERNYLSETSDFSMKYCTAISNDAITSTYDDEVLSIVAKAVTYTAANGKSVIWTPSMATLNSSSEDFIQSGDSYICQFTGIMNSGETYVTVSFDCNLIIPKEYGNSIINLAFEKGSADISLYDSYLSALDDFNDRDAAYRDYLEALEQYETAKELYDQYLLDKAEYDEALAEYDEYTELLEKYNADNKKYEDYLAAKAAYEIAYAEYADYQIEYAKNQQDMAVYLKYLAELEVPKSKLTLMNALYPSEARLYSCLMGDTVDQVIERKNDLIAAGGDEADINNSAASTENLRKLLTDYKNIKDEAQKFAYYKQHYEEIRDNFILLYSSLNSLFKNTVVQVQLDKNGRLDKFIQFIGQLYIVSSCLDDTLSIDVPGWSASVKIAGKKRTVGLKDAVPAQYIFTDTNAASPAGVTWPEKVDECIPMEKKDPPSPPAEVVTKPTKPQTVYKPTAPTPLTEPIAPQVVAPPPKKPELSPYYDAELASAVKEGIICERDELTSDHTLKLECSVSKQISWDARRIVTFYDYDGKTILYSTAAEYGSSVIYPNAAPLRQADAKYTYDFDGWVTSSGDDATASLSSVPGDISVYASYKTTLNEYTVTWKVDGNETKVKVPYGTMPVFEGSTEKASDAEFSYAFSGWSPKILRVTSDVTYTAQYTKALNRYKVRFIIMGNEITEEYEYGTVPSYSGELPTILSCDHYYTFNGWDKGFTKVISDQTYRALYSYNPAVPYVDDAGKSASVKDDGSTYTVTLSSLKADIGYILEFAKDNKHSLLFVDGDVMIYVDKSLLPSIISSGAERLLIEHGAPEAEGEISHFSVHILDGDDNDVSLSSPILIELNYPEAKKDNLLIEKLGDTPEDISFSYSEGTVSFEAGESASYSLSEVFALNFTHTDGGTLRTNISSAYSTQTVEVSYTVSQGFRLKALTVVRCDNGEKIELNGNKFTMPDSDVSIHAEFEELIFNIVFISEGTTVFSAQYRYGEEIAVPEDPVKDGDGEYIFTFIGWTPTVVGIATEDVTYIAEFRKTQLGTDPYDSGNDSNKLFTTVIPITLTVLGVGGAATATTLIIRKKKFHK